MSIPVAVIGSGYLGKFHAEKYAANPAADLKYVVDIDATCAGEIADKNGALATCSLDDIYGKVTAASVVCPTVSHFEVAEKLLEHDIDVLIEKPMVTTLEQADRLIELADRKNRLIGVGHIERFNSAMLACYERLGHPMFVECHRLASFVERGTDVDVVLDLMIHDLDIILDRIDSELVDVRAVGVPVITQSIDIANARLEFANGAVANVTASRVSAQKMRKLRIFQPDMYLSIDLEEHSVQIVKRVIDENGVASISGEMMEPEPGDALAVEIDYFLKAVAERKPHPVDGRAGRKALAAALMVLDKMRKPHAEDIARFTTPPEQ
jgi:predicted dehydrogenase